MENPKENLIEKQINIKINEEDYTIKFISNKEKNFIILIQPNDFCNKNYFKYESSLDNLKSLKYKYFKTFDTLNECIQDIYELMSLKDAKYTFIIDENENLLELNFPVNIGAKTENIEIKLKKFETSEKEIISKLSDKVKVLSKRLEILENENEQLKQNKILTDILNEFKIIKEAILISYTIDSTIITNISQINLIKSGIKNTNNNKIIFKLLYRGTRDGERPADFHKYCNGIPNTISLIQTSKGYIFGGYTEKQWDSSSGCVSDPNAFIFSLDYMKIYLHKKGNSRAIHCVSDYGPYFCNTTGMYGNFFSSNSNYEQNVNNNYEGGDPNKTYELNHGEQKFYGREVEVFQVIFI